MWGWIGTAAAAMLAAWFATRDDWLGPA